MELDANITKKQRTRTPAAEPKQYARSKVSNGSEVLPDVVDLRGKVARRYRDIASAVLADAGGVELCSEFRQQLIRRFAASAVMAEQLEAKLANGEEIDISQHALLISSMVRCARHLPVARVAKQLPTLAEYLANKQQIETTNGGEQE